LLNGNSSSTCSHNVVNFGILTAEMGSRVWGTTRNLNGFRVLASLLHGRRSTEVNRTSHDVWPSPGPVHYAYKFRGACPLTEFCQVQNSLCVQVLRIGSVTAWHSSSGRQPNFAVWYKEWNYGTFTDGATYMTGRLSRWASVHISSCYYFPESLHLKCPNKIYKS